MSTTVSAAPTVRADLFEGYRAPQNSYDEMFSAPGVVRPHWKTFAEALNQVGAEEFNRRWRLAQRQIRENGIAYNVYGETANRPRPWELDALPLLIAAPEWQAISEALVQRATLLNAILGDLFGRQLLIRRGLLPPEIVFGNPGFQPAFHGPKPPQGRYLYFYAADLARSQDGNWWIVGDRSEAPAGVAYALENRIVVSRMLSNVVHDCQVERLAPFFIALRETLQRLALQHRDTPRTVLLSQGPASHTYFEDAYLARYLGYVLVEGGDLAVRDNQVMLKTLGGLMPVDVILRRIHDEDCDPLELRGDSPFGVAGLMQARKSGNVAIANVPGSGLIESPAFMAYLPRLAKELLGEDLKLPSVATWWCGDPEARKYVLANLDRLVVRPAFSRGWHEEVVGEQVGRLATGQLADLIQSRPTEFVAQEQVRRSSAPVWGKDAVLPWHVALRTFLAASKATYIAMPGGLARMSFSSGLLDVSLAMGERSKDAWVLSEGPVRQVSLLNQPGQTVHLRRAGADLPSRVADHLYWIGRYAERAEGISRLLRTILTRLTGELEVRSQPEMPVLLRALPGNHTLPPMTGDSNDDNALDALTEMLPTIIFNEAEPYSLRSTIISLHRAASVVRDRISIDSWRIINRIEQEFRPSDAPRELQLNDALALLGPVLIDLAAFSGLVMESMTRTQLWRFLDIGRRLERSKCVISLVQSALVQSSGNESSVLESMLEVCDSSMTYRSRYLLNMQVAAVLDLLLTDETNPRSLAFQLVALADHVDQLPREKTQPLRTPEQRISISAVNAIRMVDVEALSRPQKQKERTHLQHLLSSLAEQLPKLSDAISHRYLIHSGPPRQLAEIRAEARR